MVHRTKKGSGSQGSGRPVSDALHTLRGEQFRHSQNVNRARSSLPLPNTPSVSAPTKRFLSLDYPETSSEAQGHQNILRNSLAYSGPPPPKSWRVRDLVEDVHDSAAWRAKALSLMFQNRPSSQRYTLEPNSMPSLVQLCLGRLLSECSTQEFIDDVVPSLPVHLRLELARYAAIHYPLSNSKLRALLGTEGHTDGELLIMGPFLSSLNIRARQTQAASLSDGSTREDWDSEDLTPNPLQSLLLVSTRLTTVLTLPPTLTHLALIDLEHPMPLHQLPNICPLLLFLDLSYNAWLANMSIETLKSIERVDWSRWTQLRTLGWRECSVPENMLSSLNRRRWDDVEVVY